MLHIFKVHAFGKFLNNLIEDMHDLSSVALQLINYVHARDKGLALLFEFGDFLDFLVELGDFLIQKLVSPILRFDKRTDVHMGVKNDYAH